MLDFEAGVTFGRALSKVQSFEQRLTSVEREIADLKTLGQRAALVAILWAGGMMLNLPADKIGETAGAFLRAFQK